jgi:hypothetical protein
MTYPWPGVAATEHECSLALHINSVSHIMHIIILMALHPSSIYFSQTTDGMGNLSSVQKFRHRDQFYHLLPKTLETLDSPPFFTLNNLTKILNNTIITPIQAKVAARCLVGDFIEGMTSVRIIVARARVPSVRVVEGCKCQHEVRLGWNQG